MKKISNFTLCMIVLCVITVIAVILPNLGISKETVEKDARESHQIEESWLVKKAESDEMIAMLFYPEDKQTHTFSIYVKDTISGYRFISGGGIVVYDDQVQRYTFDGVSYQAFISMNQAKINKYEIDDGCNNQLLSIDSTQPFVIVLPQDCGDITFYDINGNEIRPMN